jgi:hypothetical protein
MLGRPDAVAQAYPVKPVRIIVPLGTPEEFAAHTTAERAKWGDVIRRANIRLEWHLPCVRGAERVADSGNFALGSLAKRQRRA